MVQRARIVLYAADGMQDIDIAARLDCSPDVGRVAKCGSASSGSTGSRINRARVARAVFPPEQVAEVKAVACELPRTATGCRCRGSPALASPAGDRARR